MMVVLPGFVRVQDLEPIPEDHRLGSTLDTSTPYALENPAPSLQVRPFRDLHLLV